MVNKTGTLTEDKPVLGAVTIADGIDKFELLRIAASLEGSSAHELAHAIVAAAEARGISPGAVTEFASVSGKGVRGLVGDTNAALGNAAMKITRAPIRPSSRSKRASIATKGDS